MKTGIPSAELVFVGTDEIFSRFLLSKGFIVIPEWIMFKLDLTKPLPIGRKNKRLSSNLSKVRKYGYSFEISRDPAKFEYFYSHMYLPYSEKKHGKLSLLGGFFNLRRIFEKGGLILVNQGDECVSGFLVEMGDGIFSARYAGVKEGKIEYIEKGALAACYYFTISFAQEKGYKWIDFGHCRPFFNDGAFLHKKMWGMEIMKSERPMLATKAVIGMKFSGAQQGLLDFLSKNPFIVMDGGSLKGLIFAQPGHPLDADEIKAIFETYYITGIACLVIASSQGFTQDAAEYAFSQSPQKIYLESSKPTDFFDRQ
jgi:hypothetical protein